MTLPSARSRVSTWRETIVSRTIGISNGDPSSRTIVSTTSVPLGPRILAIASSSVSPSTVRPSTAVMTSPVLRPARRAGEPSIGATTTSRQAGPIVSQAWTSASVGLVVTSAPMPENSPPIDSRARWSSSGLMYDEYGSSSAPIIPSIAPWTSFCRLTSPT